MYCTKCGNELKENSKFCTKCGAPVKPIQPVQQAAPANTAPVAPGMFTANVSEKEKKSGSGKKVVIGIAVLIALAALGTGAGMLMAHVWGRQAEEKRMEEMIRVLEESPDEDEERRGRTKEEEATTEVVAEAAEEAVAAEKVSEEVAAEEIAEAEPAEEAVTEAEPEEKIHTYEFIIADVTWEEAQAECLARGGYLVNINSDEEMEEIIRQIDQMGYGDKKFWLGGRREAGGSEYKWLNEESEMYGDVINYESHWLAGEPSFSDGDIQEDCMMMFYYSKENRWVWNDTLSDILSVVEYYAGTIGYICEYED